MLIFLKNLFQRIFTYFNLYSNNHKELFAIFEITKDKEVFCGVCSSTINARSRMEDIASARIGRKIVPTDYYQASLPEGYQAESLAIDVPENHYYIYARPTILDMGA